MTGDDPNRLVRDAGEDDHRQGSDDAPVTLVEYGDYQCEYCGAAHPVVKAVQEAMGGELRFVFRNFPLTQIHEHAQQAAQAAEAAAAQDAFWPYHDLLYEHQQALGKDDLIGYAVRLDLDEKRFTAEVNANTYARRIRTDFSSGIQSGVNGTPTFFINGVRHDGPADVDSLLGAVRAAIG